jgi:hypothetical protein
MLVGRIRMAEQVIGSSVPEKRAAVCVTGLEVLGGLEARLGPDESATFSGQTQNYGSGAFFAVVTELIAKSSKVLMRFLDDPRSWGGRGLYAYLGF